MQNITAQLIGYMYYVSIFLAVIVLPFLIIKALVAYGHADRESKAKGRHLLTVALQFTIILVIFPPLVGLIYKFVPHINLSTSPGGGKSLEPFDIKGAGAGWIFSVLVSIFSFIIVGIEALIKLIAANITLPVINASEAFDYRGTHSPLLQMPILDKAWTMFFVIAVSLVVIGFLVNYTGDIIRETLGEDVRAMQDGVGITSYISRVVVALLLAAMSYPVGKIVLWFNGVFEKFVMSKSPFPAVNFGKMSLNPIAKAVAYMTLAPHSSNFMKAIFPSSVASSTTQSIFVIGDIKKAILLGAFQSYSIFFLVAIATFFAMRIVMVVFWFSLAPVIFAVAAGFRGKWNSISAWTANFFTWALFPSAVAVALYIAGAIVQAIPKLTASATNSPGTFYAVSFFIFLATMVSILRMPAELKKVFEKFGQDIENGLLNTIIPRLKIPRM